MQSDKEFVLDAMQRIGKTIAQNIQSRAAEMTGTELYAEEDYIPDFAAACALKNMLERTAGFVCRSTAGHVVKLVQPSKAHSPMLVTPSSITATWISSKTHG